MTTRADVNQIAQLGMEATPGAGATATKILMATSVDPGIKYTGKHFRAQGRKHTLLVVPAEEYVDGKFQGEASYSEIIYWLAGIVGKTTPVVHTGGTSSQDWTFTSVLTGNAAPQTFTIEKGDATRAFKFDYGLVTGLTMKMSHKSVDMSGTLVGQSIQDGITMSTGTTEIAEQPILPIHFNHYLDTSAGNIGTTQLLSVMEADFSHTAVYGTYWPMNRANNSFTKHVDLAPKTELKVTMEADSVGMSPLTNARAGSTLYYRAQAQGPIIEGAIPYALTLDMAVKVASITNFSDKEGIYAIEYTFEIVEDSALGKAFSAVVTNTATTL